MTGVKEFQQKIENVLVIRMSAIGDVVITLPVVEALRRRFPSARIDYVTKSEFADLVKCHPAVNQVFEFDRRAGVKGLRALAGQINQKRYDLIVDLHRNPRSIYLRLASRAVMKRVYRKRTGERLLLKWLGINVLGGAPPVCDRYFTALEDFAIERDGLKPRLYLDEPARAAATRALAEGGVEGGAYYLALAPAASYPTKQWRREGFVEAAAAIAGSLMKVAVLGGAKDVELAAEVVAELGRQGVPALNLAGKLSILESAAAIERSALLLTNDSGMMHVADALDVPLVAVFGPTSRELGFYPVGERSRVVERGGMSCRPCTLHGDQQCPKGHHDCMVQLSAKEVEAVARELLDL